MCQERPRRSKDCTQVVLPEKMHLPSNKCTTVQARNNRNQAGMVGYSMRTNATLEEAWTLLYKKTIQAMAP